MDPAIIKGILIILWGIVLGFFIGLTVKNYYMLKLHSRAISKLIEEAERATIERKARELADKIGDMIFGDDKPADLEVAIKEVAKEQGFDTVAIKKATKKTTKKATKKADKKEKK